MLAPRMARHDTKPLQLVPLQPILLFSVLLESDVCHAISVVVIFLNKIILTSWCASLP